MRHFFSRIWRWFTYPTALSRALKISDKQAQFYEDSYLRVQAQLFLKEQDVKCLSNQLDWLRAQIVQVRVQQSRVGRAGWEVMCFIPEEILNQLGPDRNPLNNVMVGSLINQVTNKLVTCAIAGINRVDSQGRVCALVFEPLDMRAKPKAPAYVQALFDKQGEYKLSEKAWDSRTEEERVRRAAGCP